ncbi:unnamed protein product [Larinioides sclopetarius]|uniref:Uncharacterized protein n=1 Tax=Larinioides sclopetarius TaxID=280406 RepID=A0AAV1ZHC9_9ARAC
MSHDSRNNRHIVTPTAPPLHLCDDSFSYVKYNNGPVHPDNLSCHTPSKHVWKSDAAKVSFK